MQNTGFSSVFFSDVDVLSLFNTITSDLLLAHPSAVQEYSYFDGTYTEREFKSNEIDTYSRMLETESSMIHIHLFINHECRERLLESGFTLVTSEFGPAAVLLRSRTKYHFSTSSLVEISSGNNDSFQIAPYQAIFAGSELTEITVLLPDDPDNNAFSRNIVALVLESLRHCNRRPCS